MVQCSVAWAAGTHKMFSSFGTSARAVILLAECICLSPAKPIQLPVDGTEATARTQLESGSDFSLLLTAFCIAFDYIFTTIFYLFVGVFRFYVRSFVCSFWLMACLWSLKVSLIGSIRICVCEFAFRISIMYPMRLMRILYFIESLISHTLWLFLLFVCARRVFINEAIGAGETLRRQPNRQRQKSYRFLIARIIYELHGFSMLCDHSNRRRPLLHCDIRNAKRETFKIKKIELKNKSEMRVEIEMANLKLITLNAINCCEIVC